MWKIRKQENYDRFTQSWKIQRKQPDWSKKGARRFAAQYVGDLFRLCQYSRRHHSAWRLCATILSLLHNFFSRLPLWNRARQAEIERTHLHVRRLFATILRRWQDPFSHADRNSSCWLLYSVVPYQRSAIELEICRFLRKTPKTDMRKKPEWTWRIWKF